MSAFIIAKQTILYKRYQCNYGADSETKDINGYRIVLKDFPSNSLKSAKPGLLGDTDAESSASCLVD